MKPARAITYTYGPPMPPPPTRSATIFTAVHSQGPTHPPHLTSLQLMNLPVFQSTKHIFPFEQDDVNSPILKSDSQSTLQLAIEFPSTTVQTRSIMESIQRTSLTLSTDVGPGCGGRAWPAGMVFHTRLPDDFTFIVFRCWPIICCILSSFIIDHQYSNLAVAPA
jgi:hypothetical protein